MRRGGALRIGLLHFTAPPIVGGVEAILGQQAVRLADRGHEVTILAGRGGLRRRDVSTISIPQLDSKYPRLLEVNRELAAGTVGPEFELLAGEVQAQLAPVFRRLDACIVHNAMTLHFNLPLTAALHRLAADGATCPLVAWCHDLSWTNPLYLPILYERPPWTLLKRAAPRAAYVVVSEDRQRDLSRLAGIDLAALAVIPAGVDLGRKWGLGQRTTRLLREHRLFGADPFVLLPVRITRRKNIEYAIRVVAELRRLGWGPKLLVTGPRGPHDPASIAYVRQLQGLVAALDLEREVILLQARPGASGHVWKPSDAMMDELYRAADLTIFPSAQEGFGIPVLEAGAVNLPLFCSDIPPFRELADGQANFFRLDEPPAAVAERIARYMEQDERYVLRRRVKQSFNWDAIFDQQVVPLLTAVTATRPGAAAIGAR